MIDIHDLICTAKALESKGFKRRAGEVWRRIAIHPETPADVKDKFWRCVEAENKCRRTDSEADARRMNGERNLNNPKRAEDIRQARAMFKAGRSRLAISKALGVSLSFVYRVTPANPEGA